MYVSLYDFHLQWRNAQSKLLWFLAGGAIRRTPGYARARLVGSCSSMQTPRKVCA
jgi:hypothetical protein